MDTTTRYNALKAFAAAGHPLTARALSDRLTTEPAAATAIICTLRNNDRIIETTYNDQTAYTLGSPAQIQVDNFSAGSTPHETGFVVDMTDETDDRTPSIQLKGGPNGYQIDMWWDDPETGRCQNSNWVNFGDDPPTDYAYDNTHDRTPLLAALHTDTDTEVDDGTPLLKIHDPDPRADAVGYLGADITIARTDSGYEFTLQWLDETDSKHHYTIVLPFADPRKPEQRETYYDHIEPTSTA